MEFKGTKGVWSISEEIDDKRDQPVLNIDAYDVGQESIVTVWTGLDVGDTIDDETKANALLISKAPETLDFINRLSGEMLRSDFVLNEKWYDQAQTLIKSATQI